MNLIGHVATKKQIEIAVKAASKRNTAPPHMLFAGVAGCGKTSMARYISSRCDYSFLQVPATDLKDYKSILDVFESFDTTGYDHMGDRVGEVKPTILFIDEIHRLPVTGQEPLGICMEEYQLASGKEGFSFWIPYFTLVGATTDDGSLSKPFRERFKMRFVFDTYDRNEIIQIIGMHAERIGVEITPKAAYMIAKRGRGVPRMVVGYLERARDLCLSYDGNTITSIMVEETFNEMGIDKSGFTSVELKILKVLYDSKIPVGLENLSVITGESVKTLSASAEPFLIRKGFVLRSGRGRIITKEGKDYLSENGYTGKKLRVEIPTSYVRK